ncbi:hypothetical protein C0J52_25549, partial [Blattella germanica]
ISKILIVYRLVEIIQAGYPSWLWSQGNREYREIRKSSTFKERKLCFGAEQRTWLAFLRANKSLSQSSEHLHSKGFSAKSSFLNSGHVARGSEKVVKALSLRTKCLRFGKPASAPSSTEDSFLLLLSTRASRFKLSAKAPFSTLSKCWAPDTSNLLNFSSPWKACASMAPLKASSGSVVKAFNPTLSSARLLSSAKDAVGTARSWLSSRYRTLRAVSPAKAAGSTLDILFCPKSSSSNCGRRLKSLSGSSSR